MYLKKIKPLLLLFCVVSLSASAQSKKELRLKVSILESQVAQMRAEKKELKKENSQLKIDKEEILEDQAIEAQSVCDSLMLRNQNLEAEIKLLQDQLFHKRLSWAKDSLNPSFMKKELRVISPKIRRAMVDEFQNHYLASCFRMKTSHRLFSEQIILEYEMNPVTGTFAGYVRHQYIPDMGGDEYNFQEIKGYFSEGEKGAVVLHITDLDNQKVEITINHNKGKSIYNKILGSEEDLDAIKTKVVAIEEFYFSDCKKQ